MITIDMKDHPNFHDIELLYKALTSLEVFGAYFKVSDILEFPCDIETYNEPYYAYRRGLAITGDLADCEFMWYNSATRRFFKASTTLSEMVFVNKMLLLSKPLKDIETYGMVTPVIHGNYYCEYEVTNDIYSLQHNGKSAHVGSGFGPKMVDGEILYEQPFSRTNPNELIALMSDEGLFGVVSKYRLFPKPNKPLYIVGYKQYSTGIK